MCNAVRMNYVFAVLVLSVVFPFWFAPSSVCLSSSWFLRLLCPWYSIIYESCSPTSLSDVICSSTLNFSHFCFCVTLFGNMKTVCLLSVRLSLSQPAVMVDKIESSFIYVFIWREGLHSDQGQQLWASVSNHLGEPPPAKANVTHTRRTVKELQMCLWTAGK